MATHERLYLDTTTVLARGSSIARDVPVDRAAIAAHAERVVYGTDDPNIGYAFEREGDGLRALELPESALRAILYDNAARLIAEAGIDGR